MTKKQLYKNLYLILGANVIYILISLICYRSIKFEIDTSSFYGFLRDFNTTVIGISVTYIGYCYQRRITFLSNLKETWKSAILIYEEMLRYLEHNNKDLDTYLTIYYDICGIVEEIRTIYKNIHEDKHYIGYYPFETFKSIITRFQLLNPTLNVDSESYDKFKNELIKDWKELRKIFLIEFERPIPTKFDSEIGKN